MDLEQVVDGLSIFWRTTDGGHTWQDITDTVLMQNGGPLEHSAAFFFIDADTGYFGGRFSHLFKTVNGGLSWVQIEIPPDAQPSTPEIDEYWIQEIYFSGSTCGWAIGNGLYSCILKTNDSGQSWQLAYSSLFPGKYFSSLHFTDCNQGGFLVTTSYTPSLKMTFNNFDSIYSHVFDGLPSIPSALCFQNDSTV